MVKSLCMALVHCPGLTCIQEGWQYHSLVDFQLEIVVYASACVLRNKMTCAMKLDYSEEEVRNVNLTL